MGKRTWVVLATVCAIGVGVFAAVLTADPTGREADLLDLASADKAVRGAAVDRIAAEGAPAVTELLPALGDSHSSLVRAGLVEAIRKAGGPAGSDAAMAKSLLASNDVAVRHAVVLTLIENPGIARVELTERLADAKEDIIVRRAAAQALGNGGIQSRAALLNFANNQSAPATVRKAAIAALARSGGSSDVETIANDGTRDQSERIVAVRSLADVQEGAALTRLTGSGTAFVRAHALAGIGRSGSANDAPTLVGLLGDPVGDVRLEALRALQRLNLEVANIGAVVVCLGDADPRLQARACQILGATQGAAFNGVQAPLRGLVASPTFRVRHDAALALNAYGDNFGMAQMAVDKDTGTTSQRKMAAEAHALISGGN